MAHDPLEPTARVPSGDPPLHSDSGSEEPFSADHDTPAEVDAAFRTQRRIAIGYGTVFVVLTLAVPALGLTVDWWVESSLVEGFSPHFLMAAVGLYVVFFLIAAAAATLASTVEDRMLGGGIAPDPEEDEEAPLGGVAPERSDGDPTAARDAGEPPAPERDAATRAGVER
ncbi:hypothetical protein [Egibacter rhizosphaerae]|uniref:hypothetical protein n=1 Tax=Egibacter rhizosphaerae TaxID=1670831 RepID=UPI00197A7EF1|nr:hypothetical protein [Egibacter rhizosphaerae]